MLTVERLEDGEVSPYLTDELRAGDQLELRGPIGGYFVWEERARRAAAARRGRLGSRAAAVDACAIIAPPGAAFRSGSCYSARSLDEVIYRDELIAPGPASRSRSA